MNGVEKLLHMISEFCQVGTIDPLSPLLRLRHGMALQPESHKLAGSYEKEKPILKRILALMLLISTVLSGLGSEI
jgi:hypothetical protein